MCLREGRAILPRRAQRGRGLVPRQGLDGDGVWDEEREALGALDERARWPHSIRALKRVALRTCSRLHVRCSCRASQVGRDAIGFGEQVAPGTIVGHVCGGIIAQREHGVDIFPCGRQVLT
jgi:hypothetical protein